MRSWAPRPRCGIPACRAEAHALGRAGPFPRQRHQMQRRRRRAAALVLPRRIGAHLGLSPVFHRQDAVADAGPLQAQQATAPGCCHCRPCRNASSRPGSRSQARHSRHSRPAVRQPIAVGTSSAPGTSTTSTLGPGSGRNRLRPGDQLVGDVTVIGARRRSAASPACRSVGSGSAPWGLVSIGHVLLR